MGDGEWGMGKNKVAALPGLGRLAVGLYGVKSEG